MSIHAQPIERSEGPGVELTNWLVRIQCQPRAQERILDRVAGLIRVQAEAPRQAEQLSAASILEIHDRKPIIFA